MRDGVKHIEARELKRQLHDGGEIALLDAREEGVFARRHLLMASVVPLSRLELLIDDLVPRRTRGLFGAMTAMVPRCARPSECTGSGIRMWRCWRAASQPGRLPAIASTAVCMCRAKPSPRLSSMRPAPPMSRRRS